jgi:hypothetical protein
MVCRDPDETRVCVNVAEKVAQVGNLETLQEFESCFFPLILFSS